LQGLKRYIATVETMKHRVFQFLPAQIVPDNKLVALALDDSFHLGILSSRVHVAWATQSGGWLGVGNDSVYVKSRCFDPFPFPHPNQAQVTTIANLAEELDATRKQILADHPDLTLTALYNILSAVREGSVLSTKDMDTLNRGRVLIMKDLHDQIDAAVMQAYDWKETLSEPEIIARLVELNQQRAEEERRGLIRWLRPDYQIAKLGSLAHRADRVQALAPAKRSRALPAFPQDRKAQAGCVLDFLSRTRGTLQAAEIAAHFQPNAQIEAEISDILASLSRLGEVETFDNGRSYFRSAS